MAIDRVGLADFLRRRREQISPAEVGLSAGPRRRTPGLRRDEVAMLAAMSTDYYTRLEQARGPHPSPQMLTAIGRALRLTDDEQDHLFHLAGQVPPAHGRRDHNVGPGLLHLLDCLDDTPACVVSDIDEVLAQNALAVTLFSDLRLLTGLQRNFTWRWFTEADLRERYPREDWDQHARKHVADLRATAARRAGDADVEDLVSRLTAASPEFVALWNEHQVAVRLHDVKRIIHPEVGTIDIVCETLLTPRADQRLLVFFPKPGTDAREKLDLLRVIGTQQLSG